jgi:hypothetical protein
VRLFPEGDAASPSGQQQQGALNRTRIPEIAKHVLDHPQSYVLGALTASVDMAVRFAAEAQGAAVCCGKLRIPMSAKFLLHDGQHRCAGLRAAVSAQPELAEETIAILLFVDPGFERTAQIFADLKGHERRLPRSLSILHDERDEYACLARQVVKEVDGDQDAPRPFSELSIFEALGESRVELDVRRDAPMRRFPIVRRASPPNSVRRQMVEWHSHVRRLRAAMLDHGPKRVEGIRQLGRQYQRFGRQFTPVSHFEDHQQQQWLVRSATVLGLIDVQVGQPM